MKQSKTNTPNNPEFLPETGYIRLKTLVKFIPFGKSTVWRKVKNGTFPKPTKLSENITAWKAEDLHAWKQQMEQQGGA